MRALDVATQDIDVERVNPSNPHQVEDEGRWVDTTIVHDAIAVKGRKDAFTFDHEFTRHGPIVAEDTDRHLAFVIRWSGAGPGGAAGLGAPALDTASSLAACQAALAHWRFPARTVECRDVDRVTETRASAPSVAVAANRAGDDVGARVLAVARSREDGGDAILRDLVAAGSVADQQKLIARWIEESVRDLRSREALPVVFAHPLALSPAARRRFNIGPTAPPRAWTGPFAFSPDVRDWDRTRVVNAPGQSESPDSAHYADQAAEWSRGAMIPLPFSDAAVQAAADVTLTIVPRAFKQP
jgi:acyl-homoserine lactone acylase PvdQ